MLFLSSSGYLVSPKKDPSGEPFWTETWKRIDRFLPELKEDLGIDEEELPEAEKYPEPSKPTKAPILS